MRVYVMTDNYFAYENFLKIANKLNGIHTFSYFYSPNNELFREKYKYADIDVIDIRKINKSFFDKCDLVISLHCKQIFPEWLVVNKRCINIHPGYNPFNKGLYPHVFSMINGLPTGVTIHEMDKKIDHGPIICQRKIELNCYDTSETAYRKIIDLEKRLLGEYLPIIVSGEYTTISVIEEGNINKKDDFDKLCKLNMNDVGTMKEHISLLRALSFSGCKNAYYIEDGKKISVELKIVKVEDYKQE